MAVPCRRCKQPFEPAGFGPLGGYLLLETTVLLLSIALLLAQNWLARLFGLSLAGLAAWALWSNHRDRAASVCPACEVERSERT